MEDLKLAISVLREIAENEGLDYEAVVTLAECALDHLEAGSTSGHATTGASETSGEAICSPDPATHSPCKKPVEE